jgi:hypothetical protein
MRSAVSVPTVRSDEALIIGATGLALVAGLTLGGHSALAYLVVALPVVVGVSWRRPAYGFALLLGLAFLTEEFEIDTLAEGIHPFLLQSLPLFRNLKDYTPLNGMYANAVELWLVMLAGVWLAQSILTRRFVLRPIPCAAAWLLATVTVGAAFVLGISGGGDVKAALWEVRALGYLLGLACFVPQIIQRRQDLLVVLWVMTGAFAFKAVQGLFRYFVVLGQQLDLNQTFMAHEDPVMLVPLLYLLVALYHYDGAPTLRRVLTASAPFMLLALVLTQRRIAYITLVVCGVYLAGAFTVAARRTFLRVTVPIVAVAAVYVLAFAGSGTWMARPIDRTLTLFDSHNPSNMYRVIELENLRYTIRAHPWGLGFGHPYEIVRSLPKLDFPLYEYIPHNEILWIWVKAGTAGFILVMFFFARVITESVWVYRRVADPLLRAVAVIIGLAVLNQLIASYFELQLTYARNMIYLGTLIGLLGPIREWGGVVTRSAGPRWKL